MEIHIKRVYEPVSPDDGLRVLVDRLWPRGLRKCDAAIDVRATGLAPSNELRRWFDHKEDRFEEFATCYRRELEQARRHAHAILSAGKANGNVMTLLYAARSHSCNHAIVLRDWLVTHL